jgi:glycosyltransferase involved in cell wall biosynthesis
MDYKFTIFTPVYNGGDFFSRVFNSIKNQTYRNFEWIIINDGSTDNTDEIITSFISVVDWDIIYIKQENRGKHIAWNKAVKLAKGDLFIPADCDDSFIPTTLEFFKTNWELKNNKDDLSGINVLCFNPLNNKVIGDLYPKDGFVTNNLELAYKIKPNIIGEKWGCIRVDLLKKIPFPDIKINSFFPESYLWFTLALNNYKVVCFNTALRGYYYESGSITNSQDNRYNKKRIKIDLAYNKWARRNISFYLLKNNKKELFNLYKKYFKILVRFTLSYFKN